jgi:hypothetical protein
MSYGGAGSTVSTLHTALASAVDERSCSRRRPGCAGESCSGCDGPTSTSRRARLRFGAPAFPCTTASSSPSRRPHRAAGVPRCRLRRRRCCASFASDSSRSDSRGDRRTATPAWCLLERTGRLCTQSTSRRRSPSGAPRRPAPHSVPRPAAHVRDAGLGGGDVPESRAGAARPRLGDDDDRPVLKRPAGARSAGRAEAVGAAVFDVTASDRS